MPSRPALTRAAFAIVLCLGALLYHLGRLGKWREDFVWTVLDPATGRARWDELFRLPFFWRPCSLVYVRAIDTLFWNQDRVRQLLAVAAHLGAAWALHRCARRFGATRCVAFATALVFLTLPHAFEVVFWPSATPTVIATMLFLLVLPDAALGQGRSALTRMTLAAAFIPWWNEQPAAGLAALPLLCLATPHARFKRAALVTALCCVPSALYLALYLATGTHGARGAVGSYAAPDELPARALRTLSDAADLTAGTSGRELLAGAATLGWNTLHSFKGFAWLAALALTGALWIAQRQDDDAPPAPHIRRAPVIAFAVAAALLMLTPMAVVRGIRVEPRMLDAPAACLILAAAVAAPRRLPRIAKGILGIYLALCSLCLIGFQTLLRDRSSLDWAQAAAVRAAFPDAPPDCLFLPMDVQQIADPTGYPAFDRAQFGAWSRDAYGTCVLRHALARADVSCKRLGPDLLFDPDGVGARVWARPGFTQGTFEDRRFTWDRVMPFSILGDGRVQAVASVRLKHPGGHESVISLRQSGVPISLPTASPHPSDASPKATAPPPAPR